MVYRLILPKWARDVYPDQKPVLEGKFDDEQIKTLNESQGYNVYFLPNYPSQYNPTVTVKGSQIDTFQFVFCDMDLKDGKYADKQAFISYVQQFSELIPSYIVDSGNGIHVYWKVSDLDPMSFLRLQRRLIRQFDTDEAVGQIYQLMRLPGTLNTKSKDNFKVCEVLHETDLVYTCDQLNKALPIITHEDEEYCKQHYHKTYNAESSITKISDKLPDKFAILLKNNKEAREIWLGNVDDRSKGDYRLGHIMWASSFKKDEALSVLINAAKALSRAPQHRIGYAQGIVDKIWTYEEDKDTGLDLSSTVREILSKTDEDTLKGTRFPCWNWLDATDHGFRLTQVIGLVAGAGVGKTAMALNMFEGFVQCNPEYDHFFIPLEQPPNEIASRWKAMCGNRTHLHDKVHIISNYDKDGNYRNLSLEDIRDYIVKFQQVTNKKVGCVVIDHIGVLKKSNKDGRQSLEDICHSMKAFAIKTNTLLVMQSQAPREKAGIGDLELNKDAAYGTVFFESYCDYLVTMWQPLKRCYSQKGCPTVTAFKFCKIRHKKTGLDKICEDVPYRLYFDSKTEHMRTLTQTEEESFKYFNNQAISDRKRDRKTDLVPYQSMPWVKEEKVDGAADNDKNIDSTGRAD